MSDTVNTNKSSYNCFNEWKNLYHNSITEDEIKTLKEMGEKFYNSIDMELYKPKEASEENLKLFLQSMNTEEQLEKIKYKQIIAAIKSGLTIDELSYEEKEILNKFSQE